MDIAVTRTLQVETIDLGNDIRGVYVRWADQAKQPTKFAFHIMTRADYQRVMKKAQGPELFKSSRVIMPCRKGKAVPSHSKASDYKSYVSIFSNDFLKTFEATAGMDFNTTPKYCWTPKTWMETIPDGYTAVWFCGYDHFLANADMTPRAVASHMMLTESSHYDIDGIREHIKQFDEITVVSDGYVPGNGKQLCFGITVTVDDYVRFSDMDRYYGDKELLERYGIDKFHDEEKFGLEDDSW